MPSKTGLQIENDVVDLQIRKWKILPENGMKILLSIKLTFGVKQAEVSFYINI